MMMEIVERRISVTNDFISCAGSEEMMAYLKMCSCRTCQGFQSGNIDKTRLTDTMSTTSLVSVAAD